ncbi:adenine nucleotide alpha hydrolase family protein [Criibacterium bergeronii]|uniref:Phosphoadenosine phosphosulfate reductase n=1 Tax=Criibacterium bergeronii TaxID=1871336 RepID=A0A1C0AG71_9FIRM|nr:phosphoadenosine phosphosulfate reductase family protein [Criibacterium bergeronii]RDY21406.1 phosphoadenosine phosphosulfate reductase [Criibacterium bergeronii]
MRYIAMCSCGKDSLAMVLKLIETNTPLTEVLFYDTGMEFDVIYKNWNKLVKICNDKQIKTTLLKSPIPFEEKAFDIPVKARDGTIHKGYSWCGGRCRWGTTDKLRAMDKYCESEPTICYVGIAADEKKRIERPRKPYKKLPLAEWGMTEQDCLEYCRNNGWNWEEYGVDLYDILDRVSCWCCRNKNKKELRNIFNYLPRYWGKLRDFQSKTKLPMKRYYKNKIEYGSVFELEIEFRKEVENERN